MQSFLLDSMGHVVVGLSCSIVDGALVVGFLYNIVGIDRCSVVVDFVQLVVVRCNLIVHIVEDCFGRIVGRMGFGHRSCRFALGDFVPGFDSIVHNTAYRIVHNWWSLPAEQLLSKTNDFLCNLKFSIYQQSGGRSYNPCSCFGFFVCLISVHFYIIINHGFSYRFGFCLLFGSGFGHGGYLN